jgi:tetratricopeptide (TPR) repeat protein
MPHDPHPGPPRDRKEADAMLTDARAAQNKLDFMRARTLYERILQTKLRRPEALLGLANVEFQTKEIDEALGDATKALQAGAADNARVLIGEIYIQQKRLDEAITLYNQVLKRDPQNREAQRGLREAENQKKSGGR